MRPEQGPWPLVRKIQALRGRYRVQGLAAITVIVTILLLVAQVVPSVESYIFDKSIIPYLTLIVVLDIALAIDVRRDVRFVANQDESLEDLISAVPGCRQVDLLEYAGATTLPLIRIIQRENVPLRLLVKHPATIDGLQQQRMITTLDTLYNSIYAANRANCQIRCYRLPYSLRGRHLYGRILELGWLTPDPARQTAYGHANPSAFVTIPGNTKEYLLEFFGRTFATYWNHSETEDALTVLQRFNMSQARQDAPAQGD